MTAFRDDAPRGGDLGGTGGTVPQNLRWGGDGPCIGPPNILRSSVVGWARKVKESKQSKKNRCRQGILLLNSAFPCKERVRYDILHILKIRRIRKKRVKIRKTWSMTKKEGHQNFW